MSSYSGITAARKCSKLMQQTGMLSRRLLSGISCTGQYGTPRQSPAMWLSPVFRPRGRRIFFLCPFSFLFLIYFSSICFYTVMYKTWGQPQPHVWGRGLLKSVTVHPRDSSGMARKRVLQKCALPHGICDEDCFYLHFLKLFFF